MPDQTVTQNPPQQPNAMGGAPTSTSSVDGQVTPNQPQPQTGAFPDAVAKVAPGAQDQVPSGQVTNTPNKPSMHARIFDQILKGMTGGDIKIVNPDGSVSSQPSTRASMGKSIVAAALTGLMSPPQYRQGEYGPIRDFQASGAQAFQNGEKLGEEMKQKPQQVSDDVQARKLRTIENNSKLLQLQLASSNLKHTRREQSQTDIDAYVKPFEEYNQQRDASDPQTPNAFLFRGADHEEALKQAKQHGLSEANMIQDGWKPYIDPETHQEDYEPTYAAINPALKNISLTKDVADRLSQMNSQFQNIHEIAGNDIRLPIGLYVSALHDYQALNQTQDIVNRLNKTINGKDAKDIDIAPLVKANRAQLVPGMYKIQQAVAAGHGAEDGENPANILDVLMNNAPQLLKPLGLTTGQAADKVTEFTAKRASALAKAKNEGTPKELADPAQVQNLIDDAGALPNNQGDTVLPILQNKDGVTKADLQKAVIQIAGFKKANQSDQTRNALAGGDPQVIKATAGNIVRGDVNQIEKIGSTRGDARAKLINEIHDQAVGLGLDPTKYTQNYLDTKATMQKEYSDQKGKTPGAQLTSFDAYLGHSAGALDALDAMKDKTLGLTRSPWANTAMDALGKQVTNDPAWTRWKTSLEPVKSEISNFLAAGYAPKADEQASINTILDPHETPARIGEAIKTLAETADTRLASLGKAYAGTMDQTFANLLSPEAAATLKRAGINSKAAAYSGKLPQGWNPQGQLQPLQDVATAKRFVAAAGGDRQRAIDLARANGWQLQ